MKVLVACERSGTVRDAFLAEGHDAWSCDIKPADKPSNRHIQDDARRVVSWEQWDAVCIIHPPCFRLANSGVKWLSYACDKLEADCAFQWNLTTVSNSI